MVRVGKHACAVKRWEFTEWVFSGVLSRLNITHSELVKLLGLNHQSAISKAVRGSGTAPNNVMAKLAVLLLLSDEELAIFRYKTATSSDPALLLDMLTMELSVQLILQEMGVRPTEQQTLCPEEWDFEHKCKIIKVLKDFAPELCRKRSELARHKRQLRREQLSA